MVKNDNHTRHTLGILLDMASIALAWITAYYIRYFIAPWWVPAFYPRYFYALFAVIGVCFLVFKTLGPHSSRCGESSLPRETWHVFYIVSVSLAMILALSFFYREYEFSRLIAVLFWFLAIAFLTANRILLRLILGYLVKKGYVRRTGIIIGAGELGRRIEQELCRERWPKVEVLGFVDDGSRMLARPETDILGGTDDLERILEEKHPDYIYIALPFAEYGKIQKIMERAARSVANVRMVADVLSLPTLRSGVSDWHGYPIIHITDSPLNEGWNRFLKRSFDIAFSALVLFSISPLVLSIAILIKLNSRGTVFYRQTRVGLDGVTFEMVKFRTMVENAETNTGPVWSTIGDKRVTSVGSFLRKTSLDELPQFWNVLKGEMSVVGPRPERPFFIQKFKKDIPKYMLRHKMKSGITGWAQVNGWRGDTSLQKRIEHDLYYIENWSFGLDLKIVFLTVVRGMASNAS